MHTLRNVVRIHNPNQLVAEHYAIEFTVPFTQGYCLLGHEYQLISDAHDSREHVPSHMEVTALWPDNSIKWAKFTAIINLKEVEHTLSLTQGNAQHIPTYNNHNTDQGVVRTHLGDITLSPMGLAHDLCQLSFSCDLAEQEASQWELVDAYWKNCFDITGTLEVPLLAKTTAHYEKAVNGLPLPIKLTLNYDICVNGDVQCRMQLHNPNRAAHIDGLWDLGDNHSVVVNHAKWTAISDLTASLSLNQSHGFELIDRHVHIEQLCSGGDNATSRSHVNKNNKVNITSSSPRVNSKTYPQSTRLQPRVMFNGMSKHSFFTLTQFWQKFPSALVIDDNLFSFEIATPQSTSLQELQPGEKWTRHFSITNYDTAMFDSVSISLNPRYVEDTRAVERFSLSQSSSPLHLLLLDKEHPQNWYTKREIIDVYGFRHFGDIFADHESDNLPDEANPLISFYNNQYDPLAGFIKQWLLTGDAYWKTLAFDLAEHVIDIDLYDTQEDKPEYNGGLFWHTDHYVDAQTSTHRTYSKHQETGVYQDHAGGGGPGGQHCYTEGLALYYMLTGSERAKHALASLHTWITRVYEGDNTVFSYLLAVKNRNRTDLKNPLTQAYPFDRGTANYINACLDLYTITNQTQLIEQVWHIITHTCSNVDNIEKRELHDIENNWFYIVLLQAIARFHRVCVNNRLEQYEKYCRATLLHYGSYVFTHASPSLVHAKQLEYPNQTWSGQDLRKVDVLRYCAHLYSQSDEKKSLSYLRQAKSLETELVNQLQTSHECHYARIQALIMQNLSTDELYLQYTHDNRKFTCKSTDPLRRVKKLDLNPKWSIKRELDTLKKRSTAIAKWIP